MPTLSRTTPVRRRRAPMHLEPLEGRQLLANIFGLTTSNQLVRFDSANPAVVSAPMPVSGLQANESLLGIDFRPANTRLYGLGSSGRVYGIDPVSGVATAIGSSGINPTLSGTQFAFDFNPTVDRIRVESNSGQNLRINPNDGTAIVDGTLAYATGDSGAGIAPQVAQVAYNNSYPGSTSTTLYVIDTGRDVLAIQNPANAGTLTTVGALGADASGPIGFDIVGSFSPEINTAYATASDAATGASALFRVNLSTGQATPVGVLGDGKLTIRAIAIQQQVETLFNVSPDGTALVTTSSYSPTNAVSSRPITGLTTGEQVVSLDVRPTTGQIYGLTSVGRIVVIDPLSAVATAVGTAPVITPVAGVRYGIDFNPTVDRIRVVSTTGQNLRVNPNDGTVIVDGTLAYAEGDSGAGTAPQVAEVAYTNSYAGATTTQLFGVDTGRDVLVLQNPANAGTLTTVGALGIDAVSISGFDIAATFNLAFASIVVAGATAPQLYTINLTTGAATLAGPTFGGGPLVGPAVSLPGAALTLPPTVASVTRFGTGRNQPIIALAFTNLLDEISAENVNNYRLIAFDRRGRATGTVRLRSATYDPTTNTVLLATASRTLNRNQPYRIEITGGVAGVTDRAFTPVSPTRLTVGFNRRNFGGPVYTPGVTTA